jgi:riboflavin-specific deaminase-like protein
MIDTSKKFIDAEQAWQLLLRVKGQQTPGEITAEDNNEPALTTLPGGGWVHHRPVESTHVDQLFTIFMPLCHPDSPQPTCVVGQIGQSLDGRIATPTGNSRYINGKDGLIHLHRLRAIADVVVIGAGTARADNPQLTVRGIEGTNPLRVMIDPRRSVPASHHLFADDNTSARRIVTDQPRTAGEWSTGEAGAQLTPAGIIELLQKKGLRRILVEGGSQTVGQFIAEGCLDRLHVTVAPMIIGSGVPAFRLPEIDNLDAALRPETRIYQLGSDVLYDMTLRTD